MRASIKRAIKTLFLLLVFPFFLLFLLMAKILNEDSTFQGFSQFFSLIPGKLGTYCRAAFYHLACPDTSDEISIGFLTLLSHRNTTIERGVYIGPQCNIGMCTVGKNALVGSGVHIISGTSQHFFDNTAQPIQSQGGEYKKVTIGDDCWIGNLSVVGADVGSQSVIGTGSIVIKSIGPLSIANGNPCKVVRTRQ